MTVASNGFGSFNESLHFWVRNDRAHIVEDAGWPCVKEADARSTFRHDYKTRKRGDTETSAYELAASLPAELDPDDWGVLSTKGFLP